jgi:hypothetical protein
MFEPPPCGALRADTGGVNLALDDERIFKEFESGRSEPS